MSKAGAGGGVELGAEPVGVRKKEGIWVRVVGAGGRRGII